MTSTQLGQGRRTVELSAGSVNYREQGEGRPVLLLHGLLTDGHFWDQVTPHLSGVRVVVPDLPLGSHRLGMARDADLTPPSLALLVDDLMMALDLRDVVLVGSDVGGAVAQLVAARHRDRIGALVLCSCDTLEHFPPLSFWYLKALGYLPGSLLLARALLAIPAMRRRAYRSLQKRHVAAELAEYWMTADRGNGQVRRDLAKVLRGMSRRHTLAAAEELRDFDRPTRLVWAYTGKVFPLNDGRRLAQMIPNATLTVVPDSYAHVPIDAPRAVAAAINEMAILSPDRPTPGRSSQRTGGAPTPGWRQTR